MRSYILQLFESCSLNDLYALSLSPSWQVLWLCIRSAFAQFCSDFFFDNRVSSHRRTSMQLSLNPVELVFILNYFAVDLLLRQEQTSPKCHEGVLRPSR